jgi:nitrite reductase/ring-hydroxylating ferredoxin subunit/(2Fe-2S) ferredoxin
MMVVYPENVWYAGVQAEDLKEILNSHIVEGRPVERLRYAPGVPGANKVDVGPKKEAAAPKAAPQWKRVCASGDVPDGGMKEFAVDGVGVLVVKAADGFVAYQAMCPHEAIPLESGIHDGCTLTCLEHMWQFDLRTGGPMGDATEGLKGYPLKEDKGELYVALGG